MVERRPVTTGTRRYGGAGGGSGVVQISSAARRHRRRRRLERAPQSVATTARRRVVIRHRPQLVDRDVIGRPEVGVAISSYEPEVGVADTCTSDRKCVGDDVIGGPEVGVVGVDGDGGAVLRTARGLPATSLAVVRGQVSGRRRR